VRYHKKVYYFLMAYRGGDVAQHDFEVEDVRWFPLDEAIERASHRTEREVLRQLLVDDRDYSVLNRMSTSSG